MYQEAIEQSAHDISIFEFAQFSLTCPGTEFGILQPNPECERVDAALAVMCRPDDEFEDFPIIPRPERIDDFNAITFIEEDMLEKLFEMYDGDRPRFDSDIYQVGSDYSPSRPSRSYHPGRVYGSGHYGNSEQEARYQCFIRDSDMVFEVLDDLLRQEANLRSDSRRYKWDEPRITMTLPSGPREIEEGEIVYDSLQEYDSLQDYDNQGQEDEPFIRAPVVSDEAAEIMADEFYYMRHNWKPLWTEDA